MSGFAKGGGSRPSSSGGRRATAISSDSPWPAETGETFVADSSGHRYADRPRAGKILSMTRTRQPVQRMAWSDYGDAGVVVTNDNVIRRIDRSLKQVWEAEVPDACLAVAITLWQPDGGEPRGRRGADLQRAAEAAGPL